MIAEEVVSRNSKADRTVPSRSGTKSHCWYLATIVVSFSVEDSEATTVHKNLMLIQARDAEDAYRSAIAIGREHEGTYRNLEQQIVTARYRGLADLVEVYDDLVHGAELVYWKLDSQSESEVSAMVRRKDQLTVFRT